MARVMPRVGLSATMAHMALLERFFARAGSAFFDLIKRLRMESFYYRGGEWGRDKSTVDIEAAMSLVGGRRYHRVLDIGTGLGHYAEIASSIAQSVIAVDISSRAIRRASERLLEKTNIKFITGNIRTLVLDGFFDLIICGDVLYYLGDRRFPSEFTIFILNITKLLAPGGRILFSNYVSGPGRTPDESASYIQLFKESGLFVENQRVFTRSGKTWHQVVLAKSDVII